MQSFKEIGFKIEKPKGKITNERQELIGKFQENIYVSIKGKFVHPEPATVGVILKGFDTAYLRELYQICSKSDLFNATFWTKTRQDKIIAKNITRKKK